MGVPWWMKSLHQPFLPIRREVRGSGRWAALQMKIIRYFFPLEQSSNHYPGMAKRTWCRPLLWVFTCSGILCPHSCVLRNPSRAPPIYSRAVPSLFVLGETPSWRRSIGLCLCLFKLQSIESSPNAFLHSIIHCSDLWTHQNFDIFWREKQKNKNKTLSCCLLFNKFKFWGYSISWIHGAMALAGRQLWNLTGSRTRVTFLQMLLLCSVCYLELLLYFMLTNTSLAQNTPPSKIQLPVGHEHL